MAESTRDLDLFSSQRRPCPGFIDLPPLVSTAALELSLAPSLA
jgi:hypothetical protein